MSKNYDKLLEKATSPLLFEVDWDSILRMCDLIRQGDVQGKYAIVQLKKKLINENVHVIMFSLQCLESFVKNCGSKVHQEVATKDTMDLLRSLATSKPENVKMKILELIQCWSHAFKKNPNYKIVEDYFVAMKLEGFPFAALKEADAMFDVDEAPVWKEDSDCPHCFRCRTQFSTFNRKHHCRACGEIFCQECSSKTSTIPKYGIEKEVRVCDVCYDKIRGVGGVLTGGPPGGAQAELDGLPIEYVNSPLFKEAKMAATKKPQEKSEQEFEEELQLALALSQSEAEEKQKKKSGSSKHKSNGKSSHSSSNKDSNANTNTTTNNNVNNSNDNPAWSKLMNQLNSVANPSAPIYEQSNKINNNVNNGLNNNNVSTAKQLNNGTAATSLNTTAVSMNGAILKNKQDISQQALNANEEEMNANYEIDQFTDELKKLLELYINRMKSDSMRGRSITNDTAVQSLFLQLQHYHPKLLQYIKYQEDARGHYESLQDKLTQLKDAREALNLLRHENQERKRLEAEERERIRQMQIAQKLQHMRAQKQTYYQYQNQLNLQRLQEQEKEIQMRLEHQRLQALKRDQQLLSVPGGLGGYPQALPPLDNLNLNDYSNGTNGMMMQQQQQPGPQHHQQQQQFIPPQQQAPYQMTNGTNPASLQATNYMPSYSQQQPPVNGMSTSQSYPTINQMGPNMPQQNPGMMTTSNPSLPQLNNPQQQQHQPQAQAPQNGFGQYNPAYNGQQQQQQPAQFQNQWNQNGQQMPQQQMNPAIYQQQQPQQFSDQNQVNNQQQQQQMIQQPPAPVEAPLISFD